MASNSGLAAGELQRNRKARRGKAVADSHTLATGRHRRPLRDGHLNTRDHLPTRSATRCVLQGRRSFTLLRALSLTVIAVLTLDILAASWAEGDDPCKLILDFNHE